MNYLRQLYKKIRSTIVLVGGVGILYVASMPFIDHSAYWFAYIILLLSIVKTSTIAYVTLKKVSKLVSVCHTLNKMIYTFGILILITLFSFATDYACLSQANPNAFDGVGYPSGTYISDLYQFFYFSFITFSTVGYGDISPISNVAKFIVMLELLLSFLIIFFSLSVLKKVHINEK